MRLSLVEIKGELASFRHRGKELPLYVFDDIAEYLVWGKIPGDFLQAIIRKDYIGAMQHADDQNLWLIPVYHSFFYNNVPALAWGSTEKMYEWAKYRQERCGR